MFAQRQDNVQVIKFIDAKLQAIKEKLKITTEMRF
jgi:hypothetical protein